MLSTKTKKRRVVLKSFFVLIFVLFLVTQVLGYFFQINYNAVPTYLIGKLGNVDSSLAISSVELMMEDRRRFYAGRNSSHDAFVPGFHRRNCGCDTYEDSTSKPSHVDEDMSTCSAEATLYGKHQRVISYSLYVENKDGRTFFLEGVGPNLKRIKELFPGWLVRIYTNIPINNYSCQFICSYNFLFWCDITSIPKLGNLSEMNGRVWRYLVVGDPTVDIFLSRDLDSTTSQRERIVVTEWESSNQTVHVIRDSHWHDTEILAGLWGLKNSLLSPHDSKYLQDVIVKVGDRSENKFWDQEIAERYIYFPYKKTVMAHDSYFCSKYSEAVTRPFPTRRVGQEFVGHDDRKEMNRLMVGKLQSCPVKCRPEDGKDWQYC